MKLTSIRHFKTVTSAGIALIALSMFALAVIAPDAVGQIPCTDNFSNSPLGIASAVEHAVIGLFN